MLVAYDSENQLVTVLEKIPKKQAFSCPACKQPVRLKVGKVMRPHFAHISLKACHFYSENESAEHLNLKAELYKSLSKKVEVAVEHVLDEIGQIADVWVGNRLALEVQCSRLSEKRLIERSQAYHQSGIHVVWLLGKKLWLGKRISSLQQQFLQFSRNMGFYYFELDDRKRLIRLKYLIYQDLKGQVYHLTKTCSFDEDVLAFLRLPYQAQAVSHYSVKQDEKLLTYIQRQIYNGNRYWLRKQEQAYLSGSNLLGQPLSAFFPQVRPFDNRQLCLVTEDLTWFYQSFYSYYQKLGYNSIQMLYSPAFYGKIKETKG
ncbi:competence protein CoiA [Streptococcus sciuri]|uniref:Competence protein CoiA family protein n=1 Tax=Streptococcus sciuri TaxID=2973939 RepID=A0ABT2F4U4_9STRE|nr:competence protein CoiA family protein [Streptococcus sciuri]MCS4487473.1 competence protein CoiA family protein [Streptococcus sciuri]